MAEGTAASHSCASRGVRRSFFRSRAEGRGSVWLPWGTIAGERHEWSPKVCMCGAPSDLQRSGAPNAFTPGDHRKDKIFAMDDACQHDARYVKADQDKREIG